jgi:hypothetical protein
MYKTGNVKNIDDLLWGFYKLDKLYADKERSDNEAINNYLLPTGQIQSDDEAITALSKKIVAGKYDDYSKIKAIHDWVAGNIAYDYDAFYGMTQLGDCSAISTMNSGRSVCQGYSNLTAALARCAGIPCKVVNGFGDGLNASAQFEKVFNIYKQYMETGDSSLFENCQSNHAWNEAYIDGKWIVVDTTWDSNNYYQDEVTSKGAFDSDYFDIDMLKFSETHAFWNSEFFDAGATNTLSDWAVDEITAANKLGLITGDLQSEYSMDITRAEFCRLAIDLITKKAGRPIDAILREKSLRVNNLTFTDTSDSLILSANALGIVQGKGNGIFDPYGAITRQEAAAMLERVANVLGITSTDCEEISFNDRNSFESWAADAIFFITAISDKTNGKRVMGGTGNNLFSPEDTYTREQSFLTILRLYNAIK